jgi:hypothetical protein
VCDHRLSRSHAGSLETDRKKFRNPAEVVRSSVRYPTLGPFRLDAQDNLIFRGSEPQTLGRGPWCPHAHDPNPQCQPSRQAKQQRPSGSPFDDTSATRSPRPIKLEPGAISPSCTIALLGGKPLATALRHAPVGWPIRKRRFAIAGRQPPCTPLRPSSSKRRPSSSKRYEQVRRPHHARAAR